MSSQGPAGESHRARIRRPSLRGSERRAPQRLGRRFHRDSDGGSTETRTAVPHRLGQRFHRDSDGGSEPSLCESLWFRVEWRACPRSVRPRASSERVRVVHPTERLRQSALERGRTDRRCPLIYSEIISLNLTVSDIEKSGYI
jgi:hypothetical protein